jgi:phosphohistidine phosphatase SixA
LLDEVVSSKATTVLCVGHSPHLEQVIALALTGTDSLLCALKKAGVARLDLEPQSKRAILLWLLPPGVARKLG